MDKFLTFLESLQRPDNLATLEAISRGYLACFEGHYGIYANNPHMQDHGGEMITEESEKNPKGCKKKPKKVPKANSDKK